MTDQMTFNLSDEHVDAIVGKAEALKRLYDNPDFKLIISEGFFKDEAIRVCELQGDLNFINDPMRRNFLEKQAQAIGFTQAYLRNILDEYNMLVRAQQEQEELEETDEE